MDQAEQTFSVPALEQLASARCVEFEAKGGCKLYPPFENIIQLWITLANSFEILRRN